METPRYTIHIESNGLTWVVRDNDRNGIIAAYTDGSTVIRLAQGLTKAEANRVAKGLEWPGYISGLFGSY